eukprot:IDg22198t1
MASETLAFADSFDSAYTIKHDLEQTLGRRIPLPMLTDSQALFDILTRAKYTTEKRLMIEIAAARQAYNEKEIDNITLIESKYNLAGALTKIAPNETLNNLMKTRKASHLIRQYIIETYEQSPTSKEKM